MYEYELEIDVDADEHGIYDGRKMAYALMRDAVQLILPYADEDEVQSAALIGAMVQRAHKVVSDAETKGGSKLWIIASEEELEEEELLERMRAHVAATRQETQKWLDQNASSIGNGANGAGQPHKLN